MRFITTSLHIWPRQSNLRYGGNSLKAKQFTLLKSSKFGASQPAALLTQHPVASVGPAKNPLMILDWRSSFGVKPFHVVWETKRNVGLQDNQAKGQTRIESLARNEEKPLEGQPWLILNNSKTCRAILYGVILTSLILSSRPVSAQMTQVIAWGRNSGGQTNVPATLTNAVAISAKGYFTLALTTDGTVVGWGNDAYGDIDVPAGLSNVVSLGACWLHSLAVRADGRVVGWGSDFYSETTIPADLSNVVAVAGGAYFSMGLRADGTVAVWGNNSNTFATVAAGLSNVVAIAAGGDHCIALRADGSVVAWGANAFGESDVPGGLSNTVAIACGDNHSLALQFDGAVVAWGSYDVVPAGLTNITAIAAGGAHSLGLRSDGTVAAWGCSCGGATDVPTGLTNVVGIAAGGGDGIDHSVAFIWNGYSETAPSLTIHSVRDTIMLEINGPVRRHYVVEEATDLSPGSTWHFKQNLFITYTNQAFELRFEPGTSRFYRCRLLP